MTLRARARQCRQASARRGFTLMELVLVLTLVVIIAAMAAPAFFGPLEDYRLLKSGDLVRARWAKTRSEAMRTGRTMMFRFQMSNGMFEIAPWQSEDDYLESSQLFNATLGPATSATVNLSALAPRTEELGEGVRFVSISSVGNSRDSQVQQTLMNQTAAQAEWSPPILFYPDGTSSTTRITLGNTRAQFVIVQLRGLSGVAEVSDLLSATELPQ